GGNTKFYGAALIRMRKEDFGQVRHHGGISPAWPIRYEDLERYYTEAEQLYQVHGLRGSDPTEPPASAPYLHPPISHEPRIQAIFDGLVPQGHRPFPIPIGLNDFYFPTEEWEYPMGHISLMGGVDGNVLRAGAPRLVPGMTLEVMAKHAVPFWMTSEDLPDPRNRVTVDGDGGIRLAYASNNDEAHRRLAAKLKSLLKHIECEEHHLIPLQAYVPGR